MAVYVIGDVQGCLKPLLELLKAVNFHPELDKVWFVGDLVNRGPDSLGVLRFVQSLGNAAVTVLGNHDLHLLAIAHGNRKHDKGDPGIHAVLKAPDADDILNWLQDRPLLHHDPVLNTTMVHAGICPQWDLGTAMICASEVEAALRGDQAPEYFEHMYGNEPDIWDQDLKGMKRLRYTTNVLTRTRFCRADGSLDLRAKSAPDDDSQEGVIPWFRHPDRKPWNSRIVFGHWSMLGYHNADGVVGIDTGCLWGGEMTALRLDNPDGLPTRFSLDCETFSNPG